MSAIPGVKMPPYSLEPLLKPSFHSIRWTIMGSENIKKRKQVFTFVVLKPAQGSGFSRSVPRPAWTAKKTHFSRTALDCRHESSRHWPRVMTKLGGCTMPLCVESSLPSLRVVGGLCLEVSLGTWGPGPFPYNKLLAIQNRILFPIGEKRCRYAIGSHVPNETSRHRPPTAFKTWRRGFSA